MTTRTLTFNVGSRKQSGQYVMSQAFADDLSIVTTRVISNMTTVVNQLAVVTAAYNSLLANPSVASVVASGTPATMAAAVTTALTTTSTDAVTAQTNASAAHPTAHITIIFDPTRVTAGGLIQAGQLAAQMANASGVDP